MEEFVATTQKEDKCLFYEFAVNGDGLLPRELHRRGRNAGTPGECRPGAREDAR